jgi:hypothetical protein
MDHLADFMNFKRLVMRLCVTFDKFANDELIESWWKVLKDCSFKHVEASIDSFIAKAGENTKFPRPAQFRNAPLPDLRDAAHSDRLTQESKRIWSNFIDRYPVTGPLRFRLAKCAQIIASTHESDAAHDQAKYEYLQLEQQIGENGRFSADR